MATEVNPIAVLIFLTLLLCYLDGLVLQISPLLSSGRLSAAGTARGAKSKARAPGAALVTLAMINIIIIVFSVR